MTTDSKSTIELVVTDLDGTLWETDNHTPFETREAIADLELHKIPLLVATGRRVASTRDPLARLGLTPPVVVLNGGLGLDLATGERFHRGGFSSEDATAVLDTFLATGVRPCVYVDDDEFPVRLAANPSTHPRHIAAFGTGAREQDLHEAVVEETVLAFSVLALDEEIALPLHTHVSAHAVPHAAPDREYGGYGFTVAPNGISKWEGIVAFCTTRDIDASKVLVLGDGPNDVEMLTNAAVAVVPSDGHVDALAIADHVIGRAADGGWAQVLDLI